MGILKIFVMMGLWLAVAAAGATPPFALSPGSTAKEEEKREESSGKWEGVAMARLLPDPAKNPVT